MSGGNALHAGHIAFEAANGFDERETGHSLKLRTGADDADAELDDVAGNELPSMTCKSALKKALGRLRAVIGCGDGFSAARA